MTPLEILTWRAPTRRPLSLSLAANFGSRWIGELPIVFDGTPAECVAYATARGFIWHPNDDLLFGGAFYHPTEPDTLYPT